MENFTPTLKEKILDKLRVRLLNVLPEGSFPDHCDLIKKFPLTRHGKIDDKSLEEDYIIFMERIDEHPSYKIFSTMCSKYLGLSSSILSDCKEETFMELGGTSITVLQLSNAFKEILGSNYPDDFLKLLYGRSLKECSEFLRNYKPVKRKTTEAQLMKCKKKKEDEDFKVLWKYDLKACVDSSPVVFQKE